MPTRTSTQSNVKISRLLSFLADQPLDVENRIENFTRKDYIELLEAIAEENRLHLKFIYLRNDNVLLVMTPSSIHETILTSLGAIVGKFVNEIGHDDVIHRIIIPTNSGVFYDDDSDDNNNNLVIEAVLDIQMMIEVNSSESPDTIPKWMGEVAFTTSSSSTRDRLKDIVTSNNTVDLAFMFTIEESPKWESPRINDPRAQQLRAEPFVKKHDFAPTVKEDGMRVIWGGFSWASVSRIALEVYIRSPDGTLVIDADSQQSDYSAHGLLYPSISMEAVDRLFLKASEKLKQSLLEVMEAGTGEAKYIDRVRESTATLAVPWSNVLLSFRTAVRKTAYQRYVKWYGSAKRKYTSDS